MDLTQAVQRGRELAAMIMTDTVIIEQQTGDIVDQLGNKTPEWTPVYGGADGAPGLVQARETVPSLGDSTGQAVTVTDYIGKIPASVQLVPRTKYRVRVIASLDPGNIGTYTGGLAETAESNGLAVCRRMHLTKD